MSVRNLDNIEFDEKDNVIVKSGFINRLERFWFYLALLLAVLSVILSLVIVRVTDENAKSQKNYQRELQIKEIQSTLSGAVIEANRGEYELSRQTANDFFDLLESALEKESVFNVEQRGAVSGILGKKAEINRLLADKNLQARDELGEILETYQKAVKGFQPLNKQEE